jgi:hypothetical protein
MDIASLKLGRKTGPAALPMKIIKRCNIENKKENRDDTFLTPSRNAETWARMRKVAICCVDPDSLE